ncbi:glycosyltransferase family 4 protein [Photobacterium japonica]|uniref:glycosyltransferase family 4 protein n=1 Tax=Photobacterium japonica TaxID=2910235 RepID=UPI003D138A71
MNKNKVVLHMNLASGFGGGEVQTLNLIKNISDLQQFIYVKKGSVFESECHRQCELIETLSTYSVLKLACKHRSNLIIHAHDGRSVHFANLMKSLFSSKVVITRRMEKKVKKTYFSRLPYYRADQLVGVSHAVKESLAFLNKDVMVIHDSFSNQKEDSVINDDLKKFDEKFVISHIANLLPIKNHDMTIAIAKRCEEKYPNVIFLLVGDGKEREHLEKSAKNLSNIIFYGFTPFVGSILKHSDLILLPSHSEGLGSIILEGYQYNLPVIAANVGGVSDIVEDNHTGVLISAGDTEQYLMAIERFVSDSDFMKQCKSRITQVVNQYSPIEIADKYMRVYYLL